MRAARRCPSFRTRWRSLPGGPALRFPPRGLWPGDLAEPWTGGSTSVTSVASGGGGEGAGLVRPRLRSMAFTVQRLSMR
jgi:hypothetical protein